MAPFVGSSPHCYCFWLPVLTALTLLDPYAHANNPDGGPATDVTGETLEFPVSEYNLLFSLDRGISSLLTGPLSSYQVIEE